MDHIYEYQLTHLSTAKILCSFKETWVYIVTENSDKDFGDIFQLEIRFNRHSQLSTWHPGEYTSSLKTKVIIDKRYLNDLRFYLL